MNAKIKNLRSLASLAKDDATKQVIGEISKRAKDFAKNIHWEPNLRPPTENQQVSSARTDKSIAEAKQQKNAFWSEVFTKADFLFHAWSQDVITKIENKFPDLDSERKHRLRATFDPWQESSCLYAIRNYSDADGKRHGEGSLEPCIFLSDNVNPDRLMFALVTQDPLYIYDPCVAKRIGKALLHGDREFLDGLGKCMAKFFDKAPETRSDNNKLLLLLGEMHRLQIVDLSSPPDSADGNREWTFAFKLLQLFFAGIERKWLPTYVKEKRHLSRKAFPWFKNGAYVMLRDKDLSTFMERDVRLRRQSTSRKGTRKNSKF